MSQYSAPLPDSTLDEIEARANAATPGPWFRAFLDEASGLWRGTVWRNWPGAHLANPFKKVCDAPRGYSTEESLQSERDADFISCARTDVPRLTAEVRRLRASNAAFRREILSADAIVKIGNIEAVVTTKVKEEIEHLRAELSSARAEMRERAAKVCEDRIIRYDGAYAALLETCAEAICALPLSPEGESA